MAKERIAKIHGSKQYLSTIHKTNINILKTTIKMKPSYNIRHQAYHLFSKLDHSEEESQPNKTQQVL